MYLIDTRRVSDFGEDREVFSLSMLAETFPYFSGTQFLAAGWEDAKGRAVAALKQPSMTATQLLFIFVAVQNTSQCLCLDVFFFLQSERVFQPCGGL